jgi:hypothetical protein
MANTVSARSAEVLFDVYSVWPVAVKGSMAYMQTRYYDSLCAIRGFILKIQTAAQFHRWFQLFRCLFKRLCHNKVVVIRYIIDGRGTNMHIERW